MACNHFVTALNNLSVTDFEYELLANGRLEVKSAGKHFTSIPCFQPDTFKIYWVSDMDRTESKLSALLETITPTFLGYLSSIVTYKDVSYQWQLYYSEGTFKITFKYGDEEKSHRIAT